MSNLTVPKDTFDNPEKQFWQSLVTILTIPNERRVWHTLLMLNHLPAVSTVSTALSIEGDSDSWHLFNFGRSTLSLGNFPSLEQ